MERDGETSAPQRRYLAQHALFDQVPKLRDDILVPDYCSLSLEEGEDEVKACENTGRNK